MFSYLSQPSLCLPVRALLLNELERKVILTSQTKDDVRRETCEADLSV